MVLKEKIIILCFVVSFFQACNNKNDSVDTFYTEKGGWDNGRIPLLKPYEAIIDNKELGWGIGLEGLDGDTGFGNIKSVNVIDSVILIYSENSILHGIDVKQSWHVIIPSKRIEKGFSKKLDYTNYLNELGLAQEPKLYDIEIVAGYFDKYDDIDWKKIE